MAPRYRPLVALGRHNEATARLVGRPHDDVALRLAQYRQAIDTEACRLAARRIVGAKLAGEVRLLRRALEMRPDRRKPLTDATDSLGRLQARIANDGERLDQDTLTGLEGAGAAAYFRAYSTLFAEPLEFSRRLRRPPPDPVNVCLSLGYTLLHHEAVREVQVVGLDPSSASCTSPSEDANRWPAISSNHCGLMSTSGSGAILPIGICAGSTFRVKRAEPA
jgi:CRISPR-associated protein Cas1